MNKAKKNSNDVPARPSMGGTQKEIQDSTNPEDTRRLYNPVSVSKAEDAKEVAGAAKKARDKQIGSSGGLRNTN